MDAKRRNLITAFGSAASLMLLSRGARAVTAPAAPGTRRLIVVMLRGAVDGLSVVVPYSEPNYYRLRDSIAIAKPGIDGGGLALDTRFGLHPALAPLLPLWQSKRLAFVHASGSPDPSRSHFDAQDYLESGTPGVKSTADGWMNRLLGALLPDRAPHVALAAASLGPTLPRIFSGAREIATVPLGRAAARETALDRPAVGDAFDRMYANAGVLGDAYREGRAAHGELLADLGGDEAMVSPEAAAADRGAPTARGFALDARQLAILIQRNPQLRLAFVPLGGWDTHANQGAAKGQLANRLGGLGEGLVALTDGLGPELERCVIVVVSEFGRTVRQNGSGGTDHGHGNVIWLIGGGIDGGKVHGQWPGLDDAALHDGRDLAITTDFRSVLGAVCERHLGLSDAQLSGVLPNAPTALDGLFRA